MGAMVKRLSQRSVAARSRVQFPLAPHRGIVIKYPLGIRVFLVLAKLLTKCYKYDSF